MRERLGRAAMGLLGTADRALATAAALTSDAARTARFLHGRARFDARADDVFVSSYPRSGTTWTLALVHLLVSGADDFHFDHLSDVTPWWERSLALRAGAPEDWAHRPSPRVFKTHLPRGWLPNQGRCLYAVRSPEDVVVSYFHLYRRYLGFDGSFDAFFRRFLAGELQYRSWFRHVAGWEAVRERPDVFFIPYEALSERPEEWIVRIGEFLGISVTPERARRIAALTSFENMKRAEARFDHEGEILRGIGVRPGSFLRQGKVARGGALLSEAQREQLARARRHPVLLAALEWRLPDFLH